MEQSYVYVLNGEVGITMPPSGPSINKTRYKIAKPSKLYSKPSSRKLRSASYERERSSNSFMSLIREL